MLIEDHANYCCKQQMVTEDLNHRSCVMDPLDEWIPHVCCSSLTLILCILQKQVKTSPLKKHEPLILITTMKTVLQHSKKTLIKITVALPPFARVIDNWDHYCSHHQLEKVSFKPLQTVSSTRTPAAWCMSVFIGANISASLIKRGTREKNLKTEPEWKEKLKMCINVRKQKKKRKHIQQTQQLKVSNHTNTHILQWKLNSIND